MAYFSPSSSGFGEFGCGAGCSCRACQGASSRLSEVYERDDEPEPMPPPRRRRRPRPEPGFGELPRPRLLPDTPQLRMRPFHIVTGFAAHSSLLGPAQRTSIQGLARSLNTLWGSSAQQLAIQVVGHIDSDEWRGALGTERATAVAALLGSEVRQLNPGLHTRIQFTVHDCGFTPGGRSVDVFVWVNLGRPAPPPCDVRLPSPAEAARTIVPAPRPETPEERIQRILRTLPPAAAPRRSFDRMFWDWVDRNLNSAMSRIGIPPSLRGPLRDGAHAAIERGAEAIFDQILDAARLTGEPREAVKATVRAALQQPVR
jgi:hypothetical protein